VNLLLLLKGWVQTMVLGHNIIIIIFFVCPLTAKLILKRLLCLTEQLTALAMARLLEDSKVYYWP